MGCLRSSVSCVAAEKAFFFLEAMRGCKLTFDLSIPGPAKGFLAEEFPRSISVAKDFLKFENKRRVILMSIMQTPGKSQD